MRKIIEHGHIGNIAAFQIIQDDKGFRVLTAAINPKTLEPIQKFGYDAGNPIGSTLQDIQKLFPKFIEETINEG